MKWEHLLPKCHKCRGGKARGFPSKVFPSTGKLRTGQLFAFFPWFPSRAGPVLPLTPTMGLPLHYRDGVPGSPALPCAPGLG